MNTANQGIMNVSQPVNAGGITNVYGEQNPTYRGFGSNWINGKRIAQEDWMRAEQAQNNQLQRDLYFQEQANKFNAQEAQKQRDYDERMSNSQYSRAVADLKRAGLNPVLALGGDGASFHSGASASSGGSRSGSSNTRYAGGDNSVGSLLGTIVSVVAGLYTAGATNAAKITAASMTANALAGKKQSYTQTSYTRKGMTTINRNYY